MKKKTASRDPKSQRLLRRSKAIKPGKCCHCGKSIPALSRRSVFCSDECTIAYHNAKRTDGPAKRKCDHCGKSYTAKTKRSKFCSTQCRVYFNRNANKES